VTLALKKNLGRFPGESPRDRRRRIGCNAFFCLNAIIVIFILLIKPRENKPEKTIFFSENRGDLMGLSQKQQIPFELISEFCSLPQSM
jgi:hypothetical protein